MAIRTKRVYEKPDPGDGFRVLVDRLWPRGLTKTAARVDYWAKSVSPSNDLRRWYGHDPGRWDQFRARYFLELEANPAAVDELKRKIENRDVTFLFSSKEERLNNAAALKDYLEAG